jgi:hypothetical protein
MSISQPFISSIPCSGYIKAPQQKQSLFKAVRSETGCKAADMFAGGERPATRGGIPPAGSDRREEGKRHKPRTTERREAKPGDGGSGETRRRPTGGTEGTTRVVGGNMK